MRVCLIAEQLLQPVPGGIGAYTDALIRYLPAQGVAVDPVVAMHSDDELHRAGLSQARRVRVPRQALYRRWGARGKPSVAAGCDLVHAPSVAFPWREKVPVVVTVHDLLWRDYPEAYPRRGVEFHEKAIRHLDEVELVLCPSKTTADAVLSLERPPKRLEVVPNGTDFVRPSNAERDRELALLEVERPYVLWVGTVEPRKNPEGVIGGFVRAVEAGAGPKDLNLYLVGPPGWWSGDIRALVGEKGLADRVRRLQAPLRAYPALYAGAEAFVWPSLAEGFGIPVVQAMACGAPVVTSNRSSLPEVAGPAALLVDPDDHDSIADALARVLRDPELAEDLRQLGYKRAADLTWERTARETAALYRDVLGT